MDAKPKFAVGRSLSEIFQSHEFHSDNIDLIYYDDTGSSNRFKQINDANADIVIVDIRDGKECGFQLCEVLQANTKICDAFVFVISDSNELAIKLNSYNAGAHGFYGGPEDASEIKAELLATYSYVNQTRQLMSKLKNASKTVRQVITVSDELVAIIDFFESLSSCHSIDDLVKQVFSIFQSFALTCSLQIRTDQHTRSFSSKELEGIVNPLELDLFEAMKNEGRILDLGKRLMLNFTKISLLVKNPPVDTEKLGRYRDHLAIVLRCAESKLKALEIEDKRQAENNELKIILSVATQILPDIDRKQLEFREKMIAVNENLLQQLTEDFMMLGLHERQEEHLLHLVHGSLEQSLQSYEGHREDEQVLRDIVVKLNNMLSKSLNSPDDATDNEENEDEDFSGGVMFL